MSDKTDYVNSRNCPNGVQLRGFWPGGGPACLPPVPDWAARRAACQATIAACQARLAEDPGDLATRAQLARAQRLLSGPGPARRAARARRQRRQAARPGPCVDLGALTGALVLSLGNAARAPGEYPAPPAPGPDPAHRGPDLAEADRP